MRITVYRLIAPDGRSYIGQTRQRLCKRFKRGKGYKSCPAIDSAIAMYGWDAFSYEVLCVCESVVEADAKEIEYIAAYKTTSPDNGFNLEGGGKHKTYIAESTRLKLAEKASRKHDPASVEKSAAAHRGLKHTPETRRKMSEAQQRIQASEEYRAARERWLDASVRKRVAMLDDSGEVIMEFRSIKDASSYVGVATSGVIRALSGEQKKSGGYSWRAID